MAVERRIGMVLVHGGAGAWERRPERLIEALAACEGAASAGRDRLARGGAALDAVEAAVRELEDAPVLNAGRGSHPKANGVVEMDALIMDGASLGLGAVAAIERVRHPVSLARRVMEGTPHTLLAGEGVSAFADQIGFPRCTNEELLVVRPPQSRAHDTVGAVAIDSGGNLACATSTGGVPQQIPGRVGDVPLAGSGGYADNASAAVSATGDGEAIMKLVLSKRVCDLVAAGVPVQAAADDAIALLRSRLSASGGLIAIDRAGLPAVSFNSAAMPWAFAAIEGRAASGSGRWASASRGDADSGAV